MSTIPPVSNNAFYPNTNLKQPTQLSFKQFNTIFKDRILAAEGIRVAFEMVNPIVASGVGECIVLFLICKKENTDIIEHWSAIHMTFNTGEEEIDDYLDDFDVEGSDYSLHLIGGDENHGPFLQRIYDSIEKKFGSTSVIASEEINLVSRYGATDSRISTALTPDGQVFWTYGMV